jgi:uncharacterized paraquat-inducible protein A
VSRHKITSVLIAVSCLSFGSALFAPLFSVYPSAGKWTELVAVLDKAVLESKTYTLPSGIAELWRGGEYFLAILIGCLSLVLPVAKLCVQWWEAAALGKPPASVMRLFRASAAYAMVEVFLVALVVIVTKGMPGGSHIQLHAGMWLFTASVVLSLVVSRLEK